MEDGQPSRTAQGAAMHRAVHQLIDTPPIFADPLALKIIGEEAAEAIGRNRDEAAARAGLRALVAARSRFTEDCLAAAMTRDVAQYVLLGAGLDTFAYREPRSGLRVFEVDHPATQGWKRARLAEVAIAIPEWVTYAPVDFERETLREGLSRSGFDFGSPAVFAWLGVTPYLTAEAVMGTLAFIVALAKGSEVIFDYPATPVSAEQRARFDALAERVSAIGEPLRSHFEPEALARAIKALGYSFVEDLDAAALNGRYFLDRRDGLKVTGGGHMMHARV